MSKNISDLLGAPYHNLLEAQVDKSPREVVVSTIDRKTFYIVDQEVLESSLQSLGFKIVIADGE
jgi:CRISPR/Cas system endoribonuclease Cas6 (RAMP superfamily)